MHDDIYSVPDDEDRGAEMIGRVLLVTPIMIAFWILVFWALLQAFR